jgi:hypothetical protein
MTDGARSPSSITLLTDSSHPLLYRFAALDVDGAGLARDPVDHGVGDGAVAELFSSRP